MSLNIVSREHFQVGGFVVDASSTVGHKAYIETGVRFLSVTNDEFVEITLSREWDILASVNDAVPVLPNVDGVCVTGGVGVLLL